MKSHKILLFIAFAILILAIICACFPKDGLKVAGTELHFPTLTKVLNPQREMDVQAYLARIDSLETVMSTRKDSMDYFRSQMDTSDIRFWFPNNDDRFFDQLFAAMESAKSSGRIIRVLHYGDSQIESDRMTRSLRPYLQGKFGGGGPGLVPFSTLIPTLAVTTSGSGSLRRQSPFGDSTVARANGNYGPMVQDFRLTGSATSNISAATHKSVDSRLHQFSQFKLIFNNRPGPLAVTFTDKDGGYTNEQHCDEEGVHSMSWRLDSSTTAIRLAVSGSADIYGIMVDDGPGVAVDNIPMRGCSGQQFTKINGDQLAAAYGCMDVGLIILQFGGNSVPYLKAEKGLDIYCQSLGEQIDHLHRCCPRALILFIGPSDMSTRIGGVMQSYAFLPTIVEKLQQMANEHGAAYWSIYHAMGGKNSMVAWVNQGLGGPDYIHFTTKGVDIMGDRLAKAFDNMYQLYKMRKGVKL